MENAGTLQIRVKGFPEPITFADWTHDRIYHTVEFENGDSVELRAFVGAIGSTIPGGARVLTEVDTNLVRTGDTGLQEGWEMLIYSIQIEVVREMGTTAATFAMQDTGGTQLSRPTHVGGADPAITSGGVLFDFLRKVYHRFQVNQKVKSEGPCSEYPQGSGIWAVGVTTSLEVASNGPPSPRDQSSFVLPIWLRPNISFTSLMRPSAALGVSVVGGAPAGFIGNPGYFDWTGLPAARLGMDVRVTLEGLVKRPVT